MKTRRKGGRSRPVTTEIPRAHSYRQLRHPFAPQSIFSQDGIARIHEMALRVVQELGIKILLPEARAIFETAGALVDEDTQMVRIGSDLIERALATTPRSYRLHARSASRTQMFEDGAMLFAPGAGCPNVSDLERGRRAGSLSTYEETIKLQQSFDVMHVFGPSAEPQDIPAHLRHYDMMRVQMECGDKPNFVYARGRAQVEQCFDMLRLGMDISDQNFDENIWCYTVINTNSPRQIDVPMAEGILDFARANQLSIITPFCLAGAMAPITISGALVLQHAECLAAITLAQLARPGAPVAYGGFSSNVDMKSGSPAFGTPEHIKLSIGSGQLARHIGLPWRSATGAASNTNDMQAAQETNMALWAQLQANATLTVHSAGWLEGGLTFGYEKFINDIEALQTIAELCRETPEDEESLGWSALSDVDPGGHFFATQHTMDRYKDAFYQPLVADLKNYGAWHDAGALSSAERATKIWQETLRDFVAPSDSGDVKDRLAPYIERKTQAGGAAPSGG
ncbi:MAG: trimethylamine--corrinoid protein Co-methyltransferase [Ascidiaceihabitans sp.]|jgi:trimethylamine--corrinoid protein Co-methyltransferase